MRKLSHGAKNASHRLRRKASSSNQSRRDESSGPVARRRSDSKTTTSSSYTVDSEGPPFDVPSALGLGFPFLVPDDVSVASDMASINEQRPEVVAPAVPQELVSGCRLTKSTKKKKQEKIFFLDAEGSKVTWSGTVTTKMFHIDNIKSIRTGDDAASQWHAVRGEYLDSSSCFIINYAPSEQSNDVKTLHLIAPSNRYMLLWVETLEALAKHREELMTGMMGSSERQFILRTHWDSEIAKKSIREGKPDEDGLDLTAITSLCRKLHIHCPKPDILAAFEYADQRGIGLLTYDHFRNFVRRLRARVDIVPIFDDWKEMPANGISRTRFLEFLRLQQRIDFTSKPVHDTWVSKIDRLFSKSTCHIEDKPNTDYLDFTTFAAFLSSEDCRVYPQFDKEQVRLDRPMNEYFISSSHNTYLLGRQVNGISSVEAYVTALRRGCRSVEIDCWDGDNDKPRVTHGFTKTTSVLFADVIHAINRCAFDASPYPVTLSLEVHCNPLQQSRMVEIMKEVFGDRLVLNLLPNHLHDLPSPEELKHKILVKVKATEAYPNYSLPGDVTLSRKRSTSSPYRRAMPVSSASSSQQPLTLVPSHTLMSPPDSSSVYSPTDRSATATSASSGEDSDTNVTSPGTSEPSARRVKTSKIIPTLAALGVYLQGYSFRGSFDLAFQNFNHIFSLNETTAIGLCTTPDNKAMFEDHNLNHMCRVYPKSLRVNSSNFDPNTFWRRGVQMVALNYQTYDTHMQMNQAMFAAGSDQSGYVLKPDYLRKKRVTSGVFEHRLKLPRHKISFSVKIISAQQLPRLASMGKNDTIDPFIEVQMFSAEDKARGIAGGSGGEGSSGNEYHGIGSPYTRRTKVVRDNGYNPQFNDLIDLTLETKYPELVFVRFIVYQSGKNSRQLAVFTSKLDSLQCGYRHIPLYNGHGEELIFSTLFCQISKRQPVLMASSLQDLTERTPRQRSFRTMLTRNMSGERGRDRGGITLDEAQLARRRRLNKEIEEAASKQM